MSIGYKCLNERSLCLVVWEGKHVQPEEWFAHLRRMGADPEVIASRFHLVDLRNATIDPSLGERELEEGAQFLSSIPGLLPGRKAAVVAGVEFSRSRVFERLVRPHAMNIIVFNGLDVACIWLGLDPEEIGVEAAQLLAKLRSVGA